MIIKKEGKFCMLIKRWKTKNQLTRFRSIKKKISLRIVAIGVSTFIFALILSYFTLIPLLRNDAVEKAEEANAEIIQQFDTLLAYVEDYTENMVLSVESNPDIIQYFLAPSNQSENIAAINLNNLINYEGIVRCVMIENDEGLTLDSINNITEEDYSMMETAWYSRVREATFGRSFSSVYQTIRNNQHYYSAVYSKNVYYNNHRFTYAVFFDMNDALYDAQVIAGNTLDDYMLMDATGNVFYSSDGADLQNRTFDSLTENDIDGVYSEKGDGLIFKTDSIKSKWSVVSYMSDSTIFKLFENYVVVIVLIMVVFLLITLITLPTVLSKIVNPISHLSEIMSTARMGEWDCEVDVTANDEVGELGKSFNKMLGDLKHSIEIITEKEKMEQKIKYSLLVSQIDPHFIYNTINSINYLARKKRYSDIITVNSALIYILQDRLRVNDIQIADTVEKEMSVVDQYIVIQKFMYDGDFKLNWHVDDKTKTKQIPKNIIQPLVENAIFHGLIDEENGEINGVIDVFIEEKDEYIILETKDNGRGISKSKLQALKDSSFSIKASERGKNIGIANIRGRLYYLYGENSHINIDSKPGEGTCITLKFKTDI